MSEVERKLAMAGVFAGLSGLEGLANAQEFWDGQPYGMRLYYGPGGGQYLHRGVLRTAVDLLRAQPTKATHCTCEFVDSDGSEVPGTYPCAVHGEQDLIHWKTRRTLLAQLEALEPFVRHLRHCDVYDDGLPCTCGLDAVRLAHTTT